MRTVKSMTSRQMVGPKFKGNSASPRARFSGDELLGSEPRKPKRVPHSMVKFTGAVADYANEYQKSKSFKIKLTNNATSAEDQYIALCPGGESTAANIVVPSGTTIDAIIGDGDASGHIITDTDKEVYCEGSPETVRRFLRYILHNPLRIVGMQLKTNDADQLQEPFYVVRHNITRTPASEQINPSDFLSASDSNEKLVEFGLDQLQFDDQTTVYFKLLEDCTLTITLFLGATINAAGVLATDAAQAYNELGITNERS
ncbi:MAG: hypothetical protein K9H26_10765 [Prolixibacteraceae bacterium]|nr:hypothetical protein [Prolixibacteraceae bacterium]